MCVNFVSMVNRLLGYIAIQCELSTMYNERQLKVRICISLL